MARLEQSDRHELVEAAPSFVYIEPDAIGATTTSGARQPSCSAISNAIVFEPSA